MKSMLDKIPFDQMDSAMKLSYQHKQYLWYSKLGLNETLYYVLTRWDGIK